MVIVRDVCLKWKADRDDYTNFLYTYLLGKKWSITFKVDELNLTTMKYIINGKTICYSLYEAQLLVENEARELLTNHLKDMQKHADIEITTEAKKNEARYL